MAHRHHRLIPHLLLLLLSSACLAPKRPFNRLPDGTAADAMIADGTMPDQLNPIDADDLQAPTDLTQSDSPTPTDTLADSAAPADTVASEISIPDSSDAAETNTQPIAGELYISSSGLRWRYIPKGSFQMGSPPAELGREVEEQQHPVELTRAYWISETEITQAQYSLVMSGPNPSFYTGCDNCPVEYVSWYNALYFANKLSQFEGREQCYELGGCTGTPGNGLRCGTATWSKGLP